MAMDGYPTGKPWLLWAHDPCPEGGWHISGEFDTQEEAILAAKAQDAHEEKRHREMVEHCKNGNLRPWQRGDNCYDGCLVTPSEVFMIKWDTEEQTATSDGRNLS